MRKIAITLFFSCALYSCTDSTGNLDFEKSQTKSYSKFKPEIGIFNFEQSFNITTSSGIIKTKLKLDSEYNDI